MNDLCPSDDELLAAVDDDGAVRIYEHVTGCDACRQRMEQLRGEVGALRSFGHLPNAWGEATVTVPPGEFGNVDGPPVERIGRYVVVGTLGSGGQADVYRVIDPDLARPLVLKLSRRAYRDDDAHRSQMV